MLLHAARLRFDLQSLQASRCLPLPQERQHTIHLQGSLAEVQQLAAQQRAALQGRGDEQAALLVQLDTYGNRIVAAEGELEECRRRGAQEASQRAQVEAAAQAVRHECSSLHDSLADLAAAESRLRAELESAQAEGAASAAALAQQRSQCLQLERAAAAGSERMLLLQAALQEQVQRLEELPGLRQRCDGQQLRVAELTAELGAARERQLTAQTAADNAAAGKQQAERELAKVQLAAQRLREESIALQAQVADVGQTAQAERQRADAAEAALAAAQEEHEAAMALQLQQHAARRARWV